MLLLLLACFAGATSADVTSAGSNLIDVIYAGVTYPGVTSAGVNSADITPTSFSSSNDYISSFIIGFYK